MLRSLSRHLYSRLCLSMSIRVGCKIPPTPYKPHPSHTHPQVHPCHSAPMRYCTHPILHPSDDAPIRYCTCAIVHLSGRAAREHSVTLPLLRNLHHSVSEIQMCGWVSTWMSQLWSLWVMRQWSVSVICLSHLQVATFQSIPAPSNIRAHGRRALAYRKDKHQLLFALIRNLNRGMKVGVLMHGFAVPA